MNKLFGTAVVALSLWNAAAFAATEVEKTCDAAPACRVVIENEEGQVQVRTWDQNQVAVKGTLGDDVERLDFNGDGSTITIEVVMQKRHHSFFGIFHRNTSAKKVGTTLTISVPKDASLNAEMINGNVLFEGVGGEITVSTVNGDLTIKDALNLVSAESENGDIEVSANAPSVTATTTNGDIGVTGKIDTVNAETVNGSISVSGTATHASLETVSGNITVKGDFPDLDTDTVNGHVSVDRANK